MLEIYIYIYIGRARKRGNKAHVHETHVIFHILYIYFIKKKQTKNIATMDCFQRERTSTAHVLTASGLVDYNEVLMGIYVEGIMQRPIDLNATQRKT